MSGSLADEIDLRFFEHGGRLDVARELYGQAPEPWIDLSTGISPWSLSRTGTGGRGTSTVCPMQRPCAG